jgi:hypothetical protein
MNQRLARLRKALASIDATNDEISEAGFWASINRQNPEDAGVIGSRISQLRAEHKLLIERLNAKPAKPGKPQ